MSYGKTKLAQAQDFATLAGTLDPSYAYPSSAEATNKVMALYGVGYGDRGYGQGLLSASQAVQYMNITPTKWNNIRNMLNVMATHQGTSTATLPPLQNDFGPITAFDGVGSTYNIPALISSIDTNRFNTNAGASMTLYSNLHTVTRATAWGSSPEGITCEVQAAFAIEDDARFFFNTGGEIRIVVAQPTGSAQDNDWNAALAAVGTISFKAHTTTRTGTKGTASNLGYYQLTTSNQLILDGSNIGLTPYSANDLLVYARAQTIPGLNGGKGFQIRFTITLQDQHTNVLSDTVSLGTNASFSALKATAQLSGIVTPTFSTITAF